MRKFIFDNHISDKIVDGNIELEKVNLKKEEGFEYFATHLQIDELNSCKNIERRNKLTEIFNKIKQNEIPTESFVLYVFSKIMKYVNYNITVIKYIN